MDLLTECHRNELLTKSALGFLSPDRISLFLEAFASGWRSYASDKMTKSSDEEI